jgi:thiamine biosynthesis protein ThiI
VEGNHSLSHHKSQTPFDTVIVRLGGEIGIKSTWTRRTYEKRLIQNIRAALKHYKLPFEAVVRQQGRIYIKTSQAQQVSEKLTRVFGIASLSPAIKTSSHLEDITTKAISLAKQKLGKHNAFAVKCKRVGEHPYTSHEVCKHVGQKILDSFPELQPKVNLTHPDITIGIEIRENQAFLFADTVHASDGLPVGTQPKIIALIESSIYSPVACWLTMKRGCPAVPVHFDESQGQTAIQQVQGVCKTLFEWSIGHPTNLYIVPHRQNLSLLKQECPEHLLEIVNKRLIYHIAARIAEKERAEAIITGETIREKPRQALRRFKLQDQAVKSYPIHRPVIGLTKTEIQEYAQKIGIPEALIKNLEEHKAIKPKEERVPTLGEVEAVEKGLNLNRMIETAIKQIEIVTL